jgi:hypothetical protein
MFIFESATSTSTDTTTSDSLCFITSSHEQSIIWCFHYFSNLNSIRYNFIWQYLILFESSRTNDLMFIFESATSTSTDTTTSDSLCFITSSHEQSIIWCFHYFSNLNSIRYNFIWQYLILFESSRTNDLMFIFESATSTSTDTTTSDSLCFITSSHEQSIIWCFHYFSNLNSFRHNFIWQYLILFESSRTNDLMFIFESATSTSTDTTTSDSLCSKQAAMSNQ